MGPWPAVRQRALPSGGKRSPLRWRTCFLRVARAVRPSLDLVDEFLRAVEAPAPMRLDQLVAFGPLLQLAHPGRRPGRRLTIEPATAARQALESLVLVGRFDARDLRGDRGVRRALDAMASGPLAILQRVGPRRTLYVLEPAAAKFAAAISAMLDEPLTPE